MHGVRRARFSTEQITVGRGNKLRFLRGSDDRQSALRCCRCEKKSFSLAEHGASRFGVLLIEATGIARFHQRTKELKCFGRIWTRDHIYEYRENYWRAREAGYTLAFGVSSKPPRVATVAQAAGTCRRRHHGAHAGRSKSSSAIDEHVGRAHDRPRHPRWRR